MNIGLTPPKSRTPELILATVKEGVSLANLAFFERTPEVCLAATAHDGFRLYQAPEKMRTHEVCLAAVKKVGWTLEIVPEKIVSPEICLAAVTNDPYALRFVPEKLKTSVIGSSEIKLAIVGSRYYSDEEDFRRHVEASALNRSAIDMPLSCHTTDWNGILRTYLFFICAAVRNLVQVLPLLKNIFF